MLPRKPFWIWRTHPSPAKRMTSRVEQYVGKRKRVYEDALEIMVPLPYVRRHDFMFMSDLKQHRFGADAKARASEADAWTETKDVFHQWLSRELATRTPGRAGPSAYGDPPTVFSGVRQIAGGLGSMMGVELRDIYASRDESRRAQRYDFLLTPPMFMFCDLTGVFQFQKIGPTTFWIQPEVHEATGEVLQGSPIGNHELVGRGQPGVQRGSRSSLTNTELQSALDYGWASGKDDEKRAAMIVRIALDSFLERGTPDPRFLDRALVEGMTSTDHL